ncbi:MAG: hypothetical protein LUG44_03385, partial [Clostridiales bacterium]|nr:hypothetical protein [Clostridiales bacterium]
NRLLAEPDWDALVELRFFGSAREIRVFCREGQWQAALLEKERSDHCIEKTHKLEDGRYGGSSTVRTWLEADEDGQMNPLAVALCGWEKETKKRVQP